MSTSLPDITIESSLVIARAVTAPTCLSPVNTTSPVSNRIMSMSELAVPTTTYSSEWLNTEHRISEWQQINAPSTSPVSRFHTRIDWSEEQLTRNLLLDVIWSELIVSEWPTSFRTEIYFLEHDITNLYHYNNILVLY